MHVIAMVFVALASVRSIKHREREPDPCTRWQGTVSGNDPSVSVTATLCPAGDGRITGTLVWESSRSGSSTRTLAGTQTGATLTLRDVALTGRPNPGWRFCKVDRYRLVLADDTLSGSYHSGECSDDAKVELRRVH